LFQLLVVLLVLHIPLLLDMVQSQSETVLGRRLVGGVNEQRIIQIFVSFRLSDSNGELGDGEAAARDIQEDVVDEDDEEVGLDKYDYVPRRRYACTVP
jgi:hypothetical protein